jgi:hypothetical protein
MNVALNGIKLQTQKKNQQKNNKIQVCQQLALNIHV